jgi:hypothetical protein
MHRKGGTLKHHTHTNTHHAPHTITHKQTFNGYVAVKPFTFFLFLSFSFFFFLLFLYPSHFHPPRKLKWISQCLSDAGYIRYYIYEQIMGASQGKSKKQQNEEARQWAAIKDNEITNLYGENTKLTNEMHLLQVDFQAMKQMVEQQRLVIEHLARENGRMLKRFEEKKEPEQEQEQEKEKQGACCCPTTEAEHDAELQRMFDEEWELVLSSHAIVSAQMRYMPGGKLDWAMLDEKGQQAATILQPYGGYGAQSIEQTRRQHDGAVKQNKEFFKFGGNHFKSVAKALFKLRTGSTDFFH